MMDFGYRALILGDPKDEYEPLCRALGVEPFAIGPGLPARINPLAFGPLAPRLGHLDRGGARPGRRSSSAAGSPWSAAWSAPNAIGEHPVPFGPVEEASSRPPCAP